MSYNRLPYEMLVRDNYKAEPISTLIIPLPRKNLRRYILRRTTHTIRHLPLRKHHLRQPKIRQLNMSILIQQYIFRLQVPVDDIPLMQVLYG